MADTIRDALVLEDESEPKVKQEEEKKNDLTSVIKIESREESGPTDGPPIKEEAMPTESASTPAKAASTEKKEGVPTTEPGNASPMEKMVPVPQQEIRGRLRQQLRKVPLESKFAVHATLKDAPNPHLYIKGVGFIGLPLSERDIKKIIFASNQSAASQPGAPDCPQPASTTVWELPNILWRPQNPAWKENTESILRKSMKGLGLNPSKIRSLDMLRHSLILYAPGSTAELTSHVRPASDSLIIAFIDIALPSSHGGGELIFSQDEKQKRYSLSDTSQFDCSYSAWFSKITLDSTPLPSGHRLVLRYTLRCNTPGPIPSAPSTQRGINELRRILLQWEDGKKKVEISHAQAKAYMYPLENYCGETPFSIAKSSESDKTVIHRLEAVCSHNEFHLYFAHVERRVVSLRIDDYDLPKVRGYRNRSRYGCPDDEDSLDEEDEEEEEEYSEPGVTLTLTHFTDRKGSGLFHGFELSYDDSDLQFIEEETFEDEGPEDEHFDCGMKTEIYTRTVAIIIPRAFRYQFFLDEDQDNGEDNISKLLLTYCKEPSIYADDVDLLADIENLCEKAIEATSWAILSSGYFSEELSKLCIVAITYLDNKHLFEDALPMAFSMAEIPEIEAAIKRMLERHGKDWLFSTLNKQVDELADLCLLTDTYHMISSVLQTDEWQLEKYGVDLTSHHIEETDEEGTSALETPGRDQIVVQTYTHTRIHSSSSTDPNPPTKKRKLG